MNETLLVVFTIVRSKEQEPYVRSHFVHEQADFFSGELTARNLL